MRYNIAIIGLGYVGLPLAHAFSKKYPVTGFDISPQRIDALNAGEDYTMELTGEQLEEARSNGLQFTDRLEDISDCNVYIITVPTPIDEHKRPDLSPLVKASTAIGSILQPHNIVIYESTVYPGTTEEICVPILERCSGLKYLSSDRETAHSDGFYCGYSPERINPGDKTHTVTNILKVTSGSTPKIAEAIDTLYASIITAGTHLAPSIRVAEAAKVIENSQRDINIAFINELAIIFNKLNIDTDAVLQAAGTKWNFLPFRPGLVGGHCIGVDPYYLTYKAQEVGYTPEIILAGRRLNDNMGIYVANQVVKLMIKKGQTVEGARILILGMTFKENCPDIRNTKVVDLIHELQEFSTHVDIYDPLADRQEVQQHYNLRLLPNLEEYAHSYDAIVLAVAHDAFKTLSVTQLKRGENAVVYDIKSVLEESDGKL